MIKGVDVFVSKEDSPKFTEKGSLQRFRKKISKHIFRGTMDDVDVLAFGVVRDEEIADINVAGPLPAGSFAVALHLDGTFIILIK